MNEWHRMKTVVVVRRCGWCTVAPASVTRSSCAVSRLNVYFDSSILRPFVVFALHMVLGVFLQMLFCSVLLCTGYDEENGSYLSVIKDHIAYRFEIKEVLGKGSFGHVVKVSVAIMPAIETCYRCKIEPFLKMDCVSSDLALEHCVSVMPALCK